MLFATAVAIAGGVADKLAPYNIEDSATESVIAQDRLEGAGFRDISLVVLIDHDPTAEEGRERVEAITRRIQRDGQVSEVNGYLGSGSADFLARDSSKTYVAVSLKPTDDQNRQDAAVRIADDLTEGEPADIKVGGPAIVEDQINEQTEEDLQRAELFAFPLLFLLTFVFFRSLVAAALPVIVGAMAVFGTFLLLWIAAEVTSVSIFALNITTGLGLGLSIDYSLFVVSRYREEIARSGPGFEALKRTLQTAGRTVMFSSITVAAALAALMIFPQQFLFSMGMGGTMVALLAAAISLVVLPAVLGLLGNRVNALAPKALQRRAEREAAPLESGFWFRLSRLIQRRPLPIATVTTVLLVAAGLPFLEAKFTSVEAQILPPERSARQVDDVLLAEFPKFRDTPVRVVVTGGEAKEASVVSEKISGIEGIVAVNPPRAAADGTVVIDAIGDATYNTERARSTAVAVRELRGPPGTEILVTGAAAGFVDYRSSLEEHIPIAIGLLALTTLAVLFAMTGSVVLPFMQLFMNLLNLSAVFGLLVFIFQDARLENLLGYESQGALDSTAPLILFAMAFGLGTDYGVFLLSRMKEARDSGASEADAISIGLERTGRIVTAAAFLFAVAVGAFATTKMVFAKETYVGVGLAVLIDATIIRALLVPSVMELLGYWCWWAPKPLRWLHHRLGIAET